MPGRASSLASLVVIALVAADATRADDDNAAREDSMFGEATARPSDVTSAGGGVPAGDREDAMFGEATAGTQTGAGASLSDASAALLSGWFLRYLLYSQHPHA